MDKEKILLDALNAFGNFTSVEQEFNSNQLEAIYEAMNQVLHIPVVVEQRKQLAEFRCPPNERCKTVCEECAVANGFKQG